MSDLAPESGMVKSTISTILKGKEAVKGLNIAEGVKVLMGQ